MARDMVERTEFELPDCQHVLDDMAKAVAGKILKPEGEEFQLICSIVNKVMDQSGRPANKRTNSRIVKTLGEARRKR